jgi:dTDP-4-amino-4,6-dideoxygalactose transaminase
MDPPRENARNISSHPAYTSYVYQAIVVTHLWGMPAKMTEIRALASRHNLRLIEDASHAQGARWRDRWCGTLGDIGVFSLQGSKLAPAGEGGILLTEDAELLERAVCLGDIERIRRLDSPAARLAATSFGIKTRMAPLSAAVARVQLRHLHERNAQRNTGIEYLSERLRALGFETFSAPQHIQRVYFEYLVRPPELRMTRQRLVEALRAEGCDVSLPRYPLLHQQPLFTEALYAQISHSPAIAYDATTLPNTVAANAELLRLPAFPRAGRELLDQYAEAFEKVVTHAGAGSN